MRHFIILLGDKRGVYLLLISCMAAVTASEAALHPLLMKAIFDAVSARESFNSFLPLGLGYLMLGVVINILNYLLSLWKIKVDNSVVAHVSQNMLKAYFAKSYDEAIREGIGYYVARIRSDVQDGLLPMLSSVRSLAISITTFLVLISVLIFISWQAFLILSIIIPVSTTITIFVGRKIRDLTNIERDTEAAVMDVLSRSIGAFKMVRSFSLLPNTLNKFSSSLNFALDSNYMKLRTVRMLQGVGDLTMVVSDVCSIFVGAFLVIRNQMTLGSFIAFMNAFWRSATTLIDIFNTWAELHGYSATIDRLISFMQATQAKPPYKIGSEISANAITYAYGENFVLSDFSLNMEAGQKTLILGENGAGKTTLANVLCGLLAPTSGSLTLPARISGITLPVHFPPILVGELPINPDLLSIFGIDHPSILDSRPDFLSAGQQQKVALSLALSTDAELYVLDEPLANLDTSSSALAMQEIQRRTKDCMLVMIMHNAEAYKSNFDQVCTIQRAIKDKNELLENVVKARFNYENPV